MESPSVVRQARTIHAVLRRPNQLGSIHRSRIRSVGGNSAGEHHLGRRQRAPAGGIDRSTATSPSPSQKTDLDAAGHDPCAPSSTQAALPVDSRRGTLTSAHRGTASRITGCIRSRSAAGDIFTSGALRRTVRDRHPCCMGQRVPGRPAASRPQPHGHTDQVGSTLQVATKKTPSRGRTPSKGDPGRWRARQGCGRAPRACEG